MVASVDNRFFNGTCDVFDVTTCEGEVLNEQFLDPCSCGKYYRCTVSKEMIPEVCPQDTLFDYKLGSCNHARDVTLSQPCGEDDSWRRCNVTEERELQLRQICIVPSTTAPTTEITTEPATTSQSTTAPSSDTNIGLIVGLSVAAAVIIVLVVLFICYRRKSKSGIRKKRETIAHNPEYFEGGDADEPYAVIDDRMMDTAYQRQNRSQTNGSFSNNGYDTSFRSTNDLPTYDNFANRPTESGYTTSLNRRSNHEYGTLAHSAPKQTTSGNDFTTTENRQSGVVKEEVRKVPSSSLDENGNKNSSSSDHGLKTNMRISTKSTVDETSGENISNEQNEETLHDYFVLNASDNL